MHTYIKVGSLNIPSYGLCIILGIIIANIIAFSLKKRNNHDENDLMVLEGYAFLGGLLGAKLLYVVVSLPQVDFTKVTVKQYLEAISHGGFVFYGGLILGLLFVLLAGKVHHIDCFSYIMSYLFTIPLIHAFGRIGCFMGGCCYGRPYNGPFAVVFPEGSFPPSGIGLFPVQLVESACLFLISLLLFILTYKVHSKFVAETYFIVYGIVRFVLEFFRYDFERGSLGFLSTSQCISIGLIVIAVISIILRRKKAHS